MYTFPDIFAFENREKLRLLSLSVTIGAIQWLVRD